MGSINMNYKKYNLRQWVYHLAEFLTLLWIFFVFGLLMVIGNI